MLRNGLASVERSGQRRGIHDVDVTVGQSGTNRCGLLLAKLRQGRIDASGDRHSSFVLLLTMTHEQQLAHTFEVVEKWIAQVNTARLRHRQPSFVQRNVTSPGDVTFHETAPDQPALAAGGGNGDALMFTVEAAMTQRQVVAIEFLWLPRRTSLLIQLLTPMEITIRWRFWRAGKIKG